MFFVLLIYVLFADSFSIYVKDCYFQYLVYTWKYTDLTKYCSLIYAAS